MEYVRESRKKFAGRSLWDPVSVQSRRSRYSGGDKAWQYIKQRSGRVEVGPRDIAVIFVGRRDEVQKAGIPRGQFVEGTRLLMGDSADFVCAGQKFRDQRHQADRWPQRSSRYFAGESGVLLLFTGTRKPSGTGSRGMKVTPKCVPLSSQLKAEPASSRKSSRQKQVLARESLLMQL